MRSSLMAAVLVCALSVSAADTWYVKPDGVDADGRGTGAETPFRTLQYAHDKAAAGDTILLLPGTYAEGEVEDPQHKNRLVVSKKLFFRATGKKSKTVIKGQLDPETGKWGANAIRCVYVAAGGYDSEFHGITFKEGGGGTGGDSNGSSGWGGCVHVYGTKAGVTEGTRAPVKTADVLRAFFVDCDFIDGKSSWGGGLNGGTAIRCSFSGCHGSSFGASASGSALWNCVIVNGQGGNDRPQVGNYSLVVNCVIYGCEGTGIDRFCHVYNTYCANMSQSEFRQVSGYPVIYDSSLSGTGKENTTSGTEPSQYLLLSPATGDYRPIAGSALIGGGKTSYMTDIIKFPADMVWKDFNGNVIDLTKETCDIGAVQGGVAAGTGRLVFPARATAMGHYNLRVAYSYAESFPAWAYYESGNAQYFRTRLAGFVGASSFRYPNRDGKIWFCYPPFKDDRTTMSEDTIGAELWTDPTADKATADGTEAHPFRTLQAAMDHITANSLGNVIVHAKPGDYNEGETFHDDATNRVVFPDQAIILRSTDGAAKTTIWGAADPTAPADGPYPGCGESAIRCVTAKGSSNRLIEGFTLANGHSRQVNYNQDLNSDRGGAANISVSDGVSFRFIDCVITNCGAVRSMVSGGWYDRCRFYDCQAYGGVTRHANLSACYVDRSCKTGKGGAGASGNAVIGTNTRTYHCTCPAAGHANINDEPRMIVNSIFCGLSPYTSSSYHYWGTLISPVSGLNESIDVVPEFCFADEASGDCRLIGNTPTTLAGKMPEFGTAEYGRWATNYAGFVTLDIDRNPIRINANGCPMAGCFQETVEGLWVSETTGNRGLVVEGGRVGGNVIGDGQSVTVSVSKDSKRPLGAYALNGVTNDFPASAQVTFSAADVAAAGGLYFEPVYSTHWYVDAENGDNGGNGFSAETAKKTLKSVLGDARVASGDTVHAAEGTYATDPMVYEVTDKNTSMQSTSPVKKLNMYVRAIVPAGVTLQADGRVEKTVIVGALDADAASGRHSLGSNAVHCVFLSGTGSTIRGFTVTGGGTDWYDTAIYANDWVAPIGGGGILGHSGGRDNVYAYDCIVSNNWAYTSAGVRFLNAIRCTVTENHAADSGGAGREFNAVGSVFDRNYQSSSAAVYDFTRFDMCTFGADNWNLDGTSRKDALSGGSSGIASISNCLILGICGGVGSMTNRIVNTVFANGAGGFAKLVSPDCYVGDGTDVLVDADLRPIPGKNPAVDRGDRTKTHPRLPLDRDLSGTQRIMNGEIDVGALEGDWRPVYARDVARSGKFSVTEVGEDVVETDGKTVAIPDGETVKAVWRNTSGRTLTYTLSVRLAEEGALTILLNGEPFRTVTETTDLTFEGPLAENTLEFAYAGTGAAELLTSRCEIGTLLLVR